MLDTLAARVASAQADIGAADPLGTRASTESSAEAAASAVMTVRLRDEAAAEGNRIAAYRRLYARVPGAAAAELSERRTTLSFARRRNAGRLSLSPNGVLLLVQIAFTDSYGQLVASRLTPVHGILDGGKRDLRECLAALAESPPAFFDAGIDDWARVCVSEHQKFWTARLERERLVAASSTTSDPLQPGLFDRRAEREREQHHDQRHSLRSVSERWIRVAEQALHAERVAVRAIAALTTRR
jgi:hypothetical protein